MNPRRAAPARHGADGAALPFSLKPLRRERCYWEDRNEPLCRERCYREDRNVPLSRERCYREGGMMPLRRERCYYEIRK